MPWIPAKDEKKQKQIRAKANASVNGLMSKEPAKDKAVGKQSTSLEYDMALVQSHTNAEESMSQENSPSGNPASSLSQNLGTMVLPNSPIPARISVTTPTAPQFAWDAQASDTQTNASASERPYGPRIASFPNLASPNSITSSNYPIFPMPGLDPRVHPAWLIARICGVEPIIHHSFPRGSPIPFQTVSNLGHGSMGFVEEVQIQQFIPFVRKTFSLKMGQELRERYRKIIRQEFNALSRLSHIHSLKVIGSYDLEPHTSTILMFPVGENDLRIFLDELSSTPLWSLESHMKRSWLSKWVICLTSAIAYIHSQGIRHQDIKPSNMVHRGDQIYLTDFSSCGVFDIEGTTSTGADVRSTLAYKAPEFFSTTGSGKHGPGTDVFALGLVFLEMRTVYGAGNIKLLRERCGPAAHVKGLHHDEFCYSKALKQIHDNLKKDNSISITSEWVLTEETILAMLAYERKERPSAAELLTSYRASLLPDSSSFCLCKTSQASFVNEYPQLGPSQQSTTPATISLASRRDESLRTPSVRAPSTADPRAQPTRGGRRPSHNRQSQATKAEHQYLLRQKHESQVQQSELHRLITEGGFDSYFWYEG